MKDAKRAERMMRKAKREIATYLSEMGIKTELVEKAHSQEGYTRSRGMSNFRGVW